jgi:creatinine amidohydrolase
METSAILHIAPHLVRPLSEAGDGASLSFKPKGLRDGWVWAQRHWSKITKDTGVGDPCQATAEKGARYLSAVAQEISEFLVEMARCDNQGLYG